MSTEDNLTAAEAKADAARQALTATLVDIQSRLNPRSLIREGLEELRDTGVEMVRSGLNQARKHPGPIIGIVATVAAYVARDWFTSNTPTQTAPPATEPGASPLVDHPSSSKIKGDPKPPPRRKRS